MSPIRVGINGFGRMGRLALRALYEYWRNDITIVHINDPKASAATAAHLLTFDSVHGRWPVPVTVNGGMIVIGSNDAQWTISTSGETNPKLVKWRDAGVDIVVESSGKFVTPEALGVYFGHEQSPRKVIVSAPVKGALNIVMGVNDSEYDEKKCPDIVTAASCTTNCLAPVIAVLLKRVGIIHGSITTIHNVTNTQTVVDAPHADLRRARSCLTSLVPTTTGSATAISLIFPELKGKLNGLAVRVPLLNASITDCAIEVKKPVTVEEVNQWMEEASAAGPLKNILGVERLPLVSADFNNDRRSAIVDATNTLVVNGTHVKLIVWYDNEVGYANRLSELTVLVAHRISATNVDQESKVTTSTL